MRTRLLMMGRYGLALTASALLVACGLGDVLSVPPPSTVVATTELQSQSGAEGMFNAARARLFQSFDAFSGSGQESSLMTDEFTWSDFSSFYFSPIPVDARLTDDPNLLNGGGDHPAILFLANMLPARSQLVIAAGLLAKFEPSSGQAKVGEAFALIGYGELIAAEDVCAGVPLSNDLPGTGFEYGRPLSTDSLLSTAAAHFDSALKHANQDPTVTALASVGLGRALLNRGKYADAATAVHNVPTSFVYSATLDPTGSTSPNDWYQTQITQCGFQNMSDREGGNGLNFLSAQDPRLMVDSSVVKTCDGGTWYYPVKFGNPSPGVPLATGAEARLIEAEAALSAGQVGSWVSDLNALRANAPVTYLALSNGMVPLTTDSTSGANAAMQVSVMFRERAFWLFGTGTRLGDLRRLIRQYGRGAEGVFPTGVYPNGQNPNLPEPLPNYGTDVTFALPSPTVAATTNPYYRGCLVSPGTA
jgi:hypothetical protein